MKILQYVLSVLTLTFNLSVQVSAQVNLDQGLILYYPFNGNAQDSGPNGNHGTISLAGCYPASDLNGVPSTAMLFNGAVEQGMIECPDNILNSLQEFSMSYWFNPAQLTNGMSLVGQDNIIETGFYTSSNRVVVWHPTSGSVNVPLAQGVNVWQHVAVTLSNTQMKIYLNGLLVNTLNGNYALGTNTNLPRIGGNVVNQSNNSWFRGKIDEVRFYNRVLTQDEVNLLSSSSSLTYGIMSVSNTDICAGSNIDVSYVILGSGVHPDNLFYLLLSDADGSFENPVILDEQAGTTSGTFSGVTVPEFMKTGNGYKLRIAGTLPLYQGTPSTQSLTIRNASEGLSTLKEGLILHYAFDGNTSDSSGLLKHGMAYGGTTFVDDRLGNPFSALQLNGTNGYVEVPPGVWFDESSFTIATWVKPTTYNNWSRILDFSNGPSSDNVVFALSNGTSGNLYCDIRKAGTSSGVVNGVPAPLNKWSHCVLTYDGIHLKIYLNGNLVGTGASTGARMVFRTQNFIGRSAWSTDAFANAAYDDFMIWDRLLSENEIKVLANDGLIFSNAPVCDGNTLYLEAPDINGASYQWSGPASFSSASRINELFPATLSMSGNYSLTITNGSCVYNQSQKQLSILSASAQATPSFAGLPANTYTGAATNILTPTPAGGFFSGPGINGNTFNPTAAGAGNHNIIYSVVNTAGCVSTVSNTVSVGSGYSMINGTITDCDGGFFDSGGGAANYQNNENYIMTFCSNNNERLQFNIKSISIGTGDTLWAYDGPDTNSELLAMYIAWSNRDYIWSSGTCLTFRFKSDASATTSGWEAEFFCMPDPTVPNEITDMSTGFRRVCTGIFRDPGGGGNYSVGTHRTQTFRSVDGERLRLDFTMLNINGNNNGHWLHVYDGPTTAYPLIGSYNEWAWPPGSKAESTGEYLTFVFDATNTSAGGRPGWEATWSCTTPALPVINIQDHDTTICAAVFCDNGGLNGNYSHNALDTITLSAISGKILELTFNHNNTQFGAGDTLWVYDGPDVNSNLKAMYITNSRMDNLYSSGTDLTFVFRSDGSGNGRGWQGYLNCADPPASVVTYDMSTGIRVVCGGVFRDPGGGGNYSVGTNRTQTFRSVDGERLRLDFTMLNINGNNNGHWLHVYDGPTTAYPLIGSYNEWAWPPGSKVESTGEYLTFNFNATNTSASSRPGWEAVWTCTTPALPHIYVGDSVSPICDAVIYDHAGPAINYGTNRKDTTFICSDNSQLLQVIFNHNETGLAAGDTLWIFDGNSVFSPPLGKYITNSRIDQIVSSGTCLTFVFSSDNANQNRGWQGVVSCITVPPGQMTYIMSTGERFVCHGTFLDPGGNGNYPRGSWVQTYTAYNGERLRFTRNMFNVNGNNSGHPFSVYDGPSTASPLIGTYTNFAFPPAVFQSTGSSLTFAFNSNNTSAGTTAGWDFSISCFSGNPVDVMWVNSPLCAGDTILIDYVLNDTVGAGNVFTAQLSDMNGNFASPANIGTLAATTDGQIEVVIPPGTLPGSGYRIRIMTSVPVQIGNPSPNQITVFAPPSLPVITPSGPVQICGGIQDVNLTIAPQSGVNYKWYRDGIIEVGSNLPFYTAQTSGSYTVVVQNSCASVTSAPVIVDAVLLPAPPVIHAPVDTGICSGQTVLLTTDSLSGVNWQWKVDGTNTGGNHFELVTGVPGIFHVEVTNACGTVFSVNSVEVFITGQIPDPPVISASGSTDLCSGEQVELSVPFLSGHDYEWKKDGQTTGTNTHTLTVEQDGVYHVIVSNLCGSATSSNSIVVALTYPPAASLILAGGPTEFCNGGNVQLSVSPQSGVSYHWFSDSIPVGTNHPFLDVDTSGNYTVSLMNVCGTTTSSDTLAVIVHSLPVVTYTQTPDLMCLDWGNVLLEGGSPVGGYYSGNGVSNDEINTGLAGIGTHVLTYTYTDTNNCVQSDASMVIIDACTDMPVSYSGFTGIFPNPVTNEFYVTCHDFGSISRIQIFSVSGSLISEVIVPAASHEAVSIGFLPSGMYIVKFLFKDGSISRHKLLKQ